MRLKRPTRRQDFEIAVFCALPREADAIRALFDSCWDDEGTPFGKAIGDVNAYSTGSIGRHNVVLVHMLGTGKANAAVAAQCRTSFTGIRLAIVAGTCGAVPVTPKGREVVLGDVIVSTGVVEYDFGQQLPEGFVRKTALLEVMGRPSIEVRAVLRKLEGIHPRKTMQKRIAGCLNNLRGGPDIAAAYPGVRSDRLFEPGYHHLDRGQSCEDCGCNGEEVVRRRLAHDQPQPLVHLGLIGSSDGSMRSGERRDEVAGREGILAFEMEAAGIWDVFPCVVIKGVSNYADGHKSKMWQWYAAATSAACTKAFLDEWEPSSASSQGTWTPTQERL